MRTTFQGLANLLLGNLLIFCSCLLPMLGDNPKDTVRRGRGAASPVSSDPVPDIIFKDVYSPPPIHSSIFSSYQVSCFTKWLTHNGRRLLSTWRSGWRYTVKCCCWSQYSEKCRTIRTVTTILAAYPIFRVKKFKGTFLHTIQVLKCNCK